MRILNYGLVAGVCVNLIAANCLANTLRVPADYPTIQGAINAAATNDTVLVSPGMYAEAINFSGKPLLLLSASGPTATIIHPPAGVAAVSFNNQDTSNSILSGFTITNGGISISYGGPTIVSNTLVDCGTAINSHAGCPVIKNNTIVGSTGNGIYLYAVVGAAIISDNTIVGCTNHGIYLEAASAGSSVIQGNSIHDNSGSGIALYTSGATTIINNSIFNNHRDGIHNDYSSPDIIQNVILKNMACGIYNQSSFEWRGPWIINNTVADNGGAGIWMDNFWADDCEIYNNIVSGNPALDLYPQVPWPPYVIKFNAFYSPTGNACVSTHGGATGFTVFDLSLTNSAYVSFNVSTNPYFACLPSGDCHLLAGSPCIESGTALAPRFPRKDFDGNTRTPVLNPYNLADRGAYAFNSTSPPTACVYLSAPASVVAVAAVGQNSAVVNFPTPEATPGATVTCQPASGAIFPAGTNFVVCMAVYGTNILTNSFTVAVLVPPYITNQPSIVGVLANSNAVLSVGAIGTAPMNYQWFFGGVAIANATNSILTVSNAQSINEGSYRVTLANGLGNATSQSIYLRILPSRALIVSGPFPISVPAGSQAVLDATVIGSAPLTMQWYRDGALLPGASLSQLIISNAQAANAGDYQLVVSNFLATAVSVPATLTVLPAKPSITLQPMSVGAVAGSGVAFESLAVGSNDGLNPIHYAWYFQNSLLSSQTGPNLSLAAISASNQGAYYVVASNTYGAATSEVAQLTIYLPPSLQTGLSNLIVEAGGSVVLNPNATGTPPMGYSWNFNLNQLSNTAASLSLADTALSQSGYYTITVTNPYGSTSSTCRVSVVLPASQVIAWGDDSGGQTDVPADLDDAVAIGGGDYHSVAVRRNGKLIAWGYDDAGQVDVPTNALSFVCVAAGADHNLAITEDGTVVAWGRNDFGQTNVPANVISALNIAAGGSHSLALLASGAVVAWGDDSHRQTELPLTLTGYSWYDWRNGWHYVPPMPARAITAGHNHSLALMYDGTVLGWGDNTQNQTSPPPGLSNVVAIAAGYLHSVALRSDGTVLAWGDNTFSQTNVPAGLSNVVAVAAGDFHTFALCSNGSITAWGDSTFGQGNVPSSVRNAVGAASGYYHGLALVPFVQVLRPHLTRSGLVLNWNGAGVLQWSPTPVGPYIDVPFQGNPWTNVDMSTPAKFFRVRH